MYYDVLSLSEWSFIRNELEGQTMKMPSISVSFRVLFSILGIVGALLALPPPTRSQGETTSAILGEATDTSNAAFAGATGRSPNTRTGLNSTQQPKQDGR